MLASLMRRAAITRAVAMLMISNLAIINQLKEPKLFTLKD